MPAIFCKIFAIILGMVVADLKEHYEKPYNNAYFGIDGTNNSLNTTCNVQNVLVWIKKHNFIGTEFETQLLYNLY